MQTSSLLEIQWVGYDESFRSVVRQYFLEVKLWRSHVWGEIGCQRDSESCQGSSWQKAMAFTALLAVCSAGVNGVQESEEGRLGVRCVRSIFHWILFDWIIIFRKNMWPPCPPSIKFWRLPPQVTEKVLLATMSWLVGVFFFAPRC